MKLADIQQQFLDYLQAQQLEQSHKLSTQVIDQGAITADQRLEIYGNAYRIRLIKIIEVDHPVLSTYLGDELFDQMVQGYLREHPSTKRSLREFCRHLPDYLQRTLPFSDHPILAELAVFEGRLRDSFDAADAERVTFSLLQRLEPEKWPAMHLRLHPSVQIYRAYWNSVESWQAIKAEHDPPSARPVGKMPDSPAQQPWLLWRGHDRLTQFRSLNTVEQTLLEALLTGADFATLCEQMQPLMHDDEIGQRVVNYLRCWFDDGLITRVEA